MTWTYSQKSGEMKQGTKLVGTGYSGTGQGRNNPDMQNVRNVGPVPQGTYAISAPYDTKTHGPHVMALTPSADTNTFGRSEFLIHGDNSKHDASEGCIILGPSIRHRISGSKDQTLKVTA